MGEIRPNLILRNTLDNIVRTPLSDSQWAQACSPLSQGGLGIRTAVANMGAARISALHSWYSSSGTQLGLRDTAAFTFPDLSHLLTLLSNQVGANVEPLCSWIRDSRMSAQPGPHKTKMVDRTSRSTHEGPSPQGFYPQRRRSYFSNHWTRKLGLDVGTSISIFGIHL